MQSEFILKGKNMSGINTGQDHKVLVMGIGNYLMGDEGVGVHIAKAMEQMDLPPYVDVIDGGTGGFNLMGYFDEYPAVIVVDATMDGKPTGTIRSLRPKFASDFPPSLSVHDVGLKDMVDVVYLKDRIPYIHLVTISIDEVKPMTIEMSEPVKASLNDAIGHILEQAESIIQKLADSPD